MWTHEYAFGNTFDTEDEAEEDLLDYIDTEEITEHIDTSVYDIISQFNKRKNDQSFIIWLSQKIEDAIASAIEELIHEIEEEDDWVFPN